MGDHCDVAVVTQAFRILNCLDETVCSISENALWSIMQKRCLWDPSEEDVATYLSGCLEGVFSCPSSDPLVLDQKCHSAPVQTDRLPVDLEQTRQGAGHGTHQSRPAADQNHLPKAKGIP